MDEHLDAGWRQRGAVKIKDAMDMCIGREMRVKTAGPKEVESLQGLGDQAVPQVERKVRICRAQACDEMIFKCTDGAFGGVPAVDVGRRELGIDVVIGQVLEESLGGFIVQALKLGFEATGAEEVVRLVKGSQNVGAGSGFQGNRMDIVGVIIIKDKEILVPRG
jgi:hypothetical protein